MPDRHPEVVVAGNIVLDIIPQFSPRRTEATALFVPGKAVSVGPATLALGGAVPNTGLTLHRLGLPVRLVGKIGDDLFGRLILDRLREYGPALTDGVIVAEGKHSSYTVVINPPSEDRFFLHYPGANDAFGADDAAEEQFFGAELFHFGYPPAMRRMYADGGRELEKLLRRAKARGLTTSLDMALPDPESEAGQAPWATLLARALPYVDLFLPSLAETVFMLDPKRFKRMGQEAGPTGVIAQADGALLGELSDRLLGLGVAVVGLKLGDQGLYVRTTHDAARWSALGRGFQEPRGWRGRELVAPCFQVDVLGTTGAGDCTVAGFLAGLLQGLPLEEAMTSAVAVGACSVEETDAKRHMPSWSAVRARIRSGWARRPVELSLPGWHWHPEKVIWIGPHDAFPSVVGGRSSADQ
jgi:sugar/nucleoside kinase (ribokinase family)